MSNFFAKLTGRLLTVVFGGKPKTITVKSEEEKQELDFYIQNLKEFIMRMSRWLYFKYFF